MYGQRLRWNIRSMKVELDGKQLDTSLFYLHLREFSINADKTTAKDCAIKYAKTNSFDPFREDLDKCLAARAESSDSDFQLDSEFENLASRLFFDEDAHDIADAALQNRMLSLWMTAAAGRVYSPGCKFGHILVLHGGQGLGKTSFFEIMGGEWRRSMYMSPRDISHDWYIPTATSPLVADIRDIGSPSIRKEFMPRQEDMVRYPYDREATILQRSSVLGTESNTVPHRFARDSCALIIDVRKPVDLAYLRGNRDRIWGYFAAKYKAMQQSCPPGKTPALSMDTDAIIRRNRRLHGL